MVPEECSMMKRKYTKYSKEFKLEAIRLAEGSDKPVTQVARELGLRVKAILRKLNMHSRVEAAVFAVEHGLIQKS